MMLNKLSNVVKFVKKNKINSEIKYSVFPCPQGDNVCLSFELDNSYEPFLDGKTCYGHEWFEFIKGTDRSVEMDSLVNSILVDLEDTNTLVDVYGVFHLGKFIITHVIADYNKLFATSGLSIICPKDVYLASEFSYYPAKLNLNDKQRTIDTIKSHSDIISTDNPIQNYFKFENWTNEKTIWIADENHGFSTYELSFITNVNTLKYDHEATITDGDKGKAVVKFMDSFAIEELMSTEGIRYMNDNKLPLNNHHTPHFVRFVCTELSKLSLYKERLVSYGIKEEDVLPKLQERIRAWWLRWIAQ